MNKNRKQDHTEFLSVYLPCQTDLRAFVMALVRDPHAADDIMQETAVVLWNKFAEYNPSRPFGAWARTFARFQILAYCKKQKRSRLVLGEVAMSAVDQAMDVMEDETSTSDAQEALQQCLKELSDRARTLLELRYHERLGLDVICEKAGMSLAAVKKSMLRAREALRQCCRRKQEESSHD